MSIRGIVEPGVPTSEPAGSHQHDQGSFAAHLQGDAVLMCSGELDPSTNSALRRSLRRVVRLAPDRVVIDLSRVSFFDGGAIGEFVRARNSSRAAGGDLVVRAPSPFGRRVLGLVGLTNLIDEEPGPGEGDASSAAVHRAETIEPTAVLAGRFAAASRSHVVIDEAMGLIAEHFDVGIEEASVMLRTFSIAEQQSVLAAAAALIDRSIAVARLAPLRPGRPPAAADVDDEQREHGRAPAGGG